MAACKATRGLACHGVSARCGVSSGVWRWPRSKKWHGCWPGRGGAAGIKASPSIGTLNGVQAQKYNCSTKEGVELVAVARQVGPSPHSGKGYRDLKSVASEVAGLSGTQRVTVDCQHGQRTAVSLDVCQRR